MTVTLTDDVRWINECYPHGNEHEHVSVYLIDHGGRYILIDSGSFYHRPAIRDRIERETDGEGLDAILLSHSDYPHAGNVSEFREQWEGVELIASSGSPEIQGLSDALQCPIGGSLKVVGRRFEFIDPPLADRSHTTWIYDVESGVLFTADGFGSYHDPGTCRYTSREFANGIAEEKLYEFHRQNLVWLRYVDPSKLQLALKGILDTYEPTYIAPIHGHPIPGMEVDRHLERLVSAVDLISSEYTVPEP